MSSPFLARKMPSYPHFTQQSWETAVSPYENPLSDRIFDRFVNWNATRNFLSNWKVTLDSWITLFQATTLPESDPIRPVHIEEAVNALESVINSRPGDDLPARFGYLQLANFLDALESRIKARREAWLDPHDRSRDSYTSIAYRVYLKAQGLDSDSQKLRNDLSRKRAIGRNWRPYTGSSSLLLIIYSDFAEKSIWVVVGFTCRIRLSLPIK